MPHRGSSQPACSKKGLTASAAPMTSGNDEIQIIREIFYAYGQVMMLRFQILSMALIMELYSEPHWADSCPRFTTLNERFDRARQLRLCFKTCLRGHNQNDCTRNVSCYHYKRKEHPTALCKTWHRSQHGKEENPVGDTQAIRTVAAIATPGHQERDKMVLLLSTFVEVRDGEPHTKTIKVPVLFDVGSERSFITEEIVQQLGIEVTHKEPLIVDGFGGMHITHCTSARVKLKMKRTDGRLFTMFANSAPRLISETAIAKLTEKTLRRKN
uniref:Peptidase aspartic putative domain-containing protein n=1 Tax=Parascaris univalens TaxID=6257 RepID=A0A915C056_PARUN